MAATGLGGDHLEPEDQRSGCWCCGDRTVRCSLLRLSEHPEVGVRFRCVKTLTKRQRAIERATRRAPAGPWWRRAQYRLGFGHC